MGENAARVQLLYIHLGEVLLTYLLNLTTEQVSRIYSDLPEVLSTSQRTILDQLVELDGQFDAAQQPGDITYRWRLYLSSIHESTGISIGNTARQVCGGMLEAVPSGLSRVEDLLANLAVDVYPALLVQESRTRSVVDSTVSIYRHPLHDQFQEAVMEDVELCKVFMQDSPHIGRHATILRSTGQGGGCQLVLLASTLIGSGWRLARTGEVNPTPDDLVRASLTSLHTLRDAVKGADVTVPARIGLTGVHLPPSVEELDLGWGRVRKTNTQDEMFIRTTSLDGQLETTTATGDKVVINYSGDLVLEVDIPYVVKIGDPPWPEELNIGRQTIEKYLENVRLGLLLAFPELKPTIVSSWRVMLDPLEQGSGTGWSDVERTPGLVPFQLTNVQAREWKKWIERIAKNRAPAIAVAIRRMLAATSERYTPEDILVDAVVVWENLFGAKTETTLRITSSLAWLLGDSAKDRLTKQILYKNIYSARSDVVHGVVNVKSEKIQEYSHEAVIVSIRALRAIFTSHVTLLKIGSSEKRSIQILHEGDHHS